MFTVYIRMWEELAPGWAHGKIASINKSKATFTVLYFDGAG